MSSQEIENNKSLNGSYYRIKFLIYGITYSIWGYISHYLITDKEPYYERVILGILFCIYGFFCNNVIEKYGQKKNQYISQLIDIVVAIHYYTLMLRTYEWDESFFIAYVFGFLVVMFATGFTTRVVPELVSWSIINFLVSIAISFKITFIHPVLFILFVSTILLYVGVIGVNSARLLSKLLEDTEKRKEILSNMIEGVVVQNSSGEILEYNLVALNILGLTEWQLHDERYLKHDRFFYHEEADEKQPLLKIFAHSQSLLGTGNVAKIFENNDLVKWVKVSWSKFILNGESIFITTLDDITADVLKNAQLQTQKEIANHKSKLASLGELAAGVGHEINNPLAIISGQAQILRKFIDRDVSKDLCYQRLDKIQNSVERVNKITKGLRTFSRAEKSEISYFDLSETLVESIDIFKDVSTSDCIKVFTNIEKELWIKANKGRLVQVLLNLLNNAKDALMDSERKIIEINAYTKNNYIHISVKDYGCGIEEEIGKFIFQPFFTTKDVDKGTGIGLSLVSSIVKEHEGEISVVSELGMWTEFKIELPLVTKNEVDSWNKILNEEQIKEQTKRSTFIQNFNGMALVVDDEEDVREIIVEMLKDFNIECVEAINGIEALKEIQTRDIQLVISDIKMPYMSGLELLKSLRADNYNGKFYFISGGVNIDVSEYSQMIDGFFKKPFEEYDIKSMLS